MKCKNGPQRSWDHPRELILGCLHICGSCFSPGAPFNTSATWRTVYSVTKMQEWRCKECPRELKLGLLAYFWIIFSLWGPFITNTIWRGWLFRNRNANMGLGEERNLPESSNLVCLHISGLCFALRGPFTTSTTYLMELLIFLLKRKIATKRSQEPGHEPGHAWT